MQTLNVARDGTLRQHSDGHRRRAARERPTPVVDGLRPVAWAADAVAEPSGPRFVRGIQCDHVPGVHARAA